MGKIMDLWESIFTRIIICYIQFVYQTSKVIKTGNENLLNDEHDEKFVIGFWHGDSYCYYHLLKNRGIYIITTENRRGNYIANISRHFGYIPIRVPDESDGGNHLLKIIKQINESHRQHLALTLDGPLGPRHVPKKFAMITALAAKRRMLLISIKVKRKIRLTNRWDKYMIPLPFNTIEVHFHEPIAIKKKEFEQQGEKIAENMAARSCFQHGS